MRHQQRWLFFETTTEQFIILKNAITFCNCVYFTETNVIDIETIVFSIV